MHEWAGSGTSISDYTTRLRNVQLEIHWTSDDGGEGR